MSPRSGSGRVRAMRDFPLVFWLAAAVVVAFVHRWVPSSTWLLVHLVALGAMVHAVLVWSAHFAQALLKTRPDPAAECRAVMRQGGLLAGSAAVLVGVPTVHWWLTLAGGLVVATVVAWHGLDMARDLRRALPGRFRIAVRYYVAAAACLPVGIGFGVALAWGLGDRWHANLLVAHTMTNLLGFIGLTVVGTLVTFWPTVLRTRMDERAERLAVRALPILIGSLIVVDLGALTERPLAAAGIVGYAVGLLWWGRSLVGPARHRPPREFASASIGAACLWAVVALVATAWRVLASDDVALADRYPMLASIWVVGFLVQLVTGALSYLMPSVFGGGPRVVRAGAAAFDRFATLRLVVINLGLVLWLLPLPSWVRVTTSVAVLLALAAFLPILVSATIALIREKRRAAAGEPAAPVERPNAIGWRGAVAGLAVIALAAGAGVAVDPTAAGFSTRSDEAVTPTGVSVHVDVVAADMKFTPSSVEVAPGDRVVITLHSEDSTTVHDLQIGGQRTPRISGGQTAELDLGVVGASEQGWCTVVGHRQMGMVFDVVVAGSTASASASASMDHQAMTTSGELDDVVDPVAPATTSDTLHKLTLTVEETPLQVAPGVWQQRWTYNGASVAPTIRGRVGDTFEVTLVNNGSMGHSVDFHASNLAPNDPMRTIAPGESLVYRFTAERSGIWMYHCSTSPMTAHIAAGMHGAVIIEPAGGLPKVDREYVLVQSELYVDGAGDSAEAALPVDASTALAAGEPDFVAFNGIANQYDQVRLSAAVGERVRFWVLDAGPNRASSFHIVGGQFDTVYKEGAYLLRQGVGNGTTDGGSQALDLMPAQGGFVELVFPEAGDYPVVTHVMADAERGAHGFVHVS